jgi:hypothetical protein
MGELDGALEAFHAEQAADAVARAEMVRASKVRRTRIEALALEFVRRATDEGIAMETLSGTVGYRHERHAIPHAAGLFRTKQISEPATRRVPIVAKRDFWIVKQGRDASHGSGEYPIHTASEDGIYVSGEGQVAVGTPSAVLNPESPSHEMAFNAGSISPQALAQAMAAFLGRRGVR